MQRTLVLAFMGFLSLVAYGLSASVRAADFYQVNTATSQTITEWGACRKITNAHASNLALYVPTKTAPEWSSAYLNPPAGVTVAACNDAVSLRFRSSANAQMTRVPASSGSRTTFTYSAWVKPGAAAIGVGYYGLFGQWNGASGSSGLSLFVNGNQITGTIDDYTGGSAPAASYTTAGLIRDPSAWYHIVAVFDTTQAAQANRFKVYVNGVAAVVTMGTVYGTFSQNYSMSFGNTAYPMRIGAFTTNNSTFYGWDGYMSNVNLIDGQALTPQAFGQLDANNQWVPKAYTGTYGTNGVYLNFADSTNTTATTLGKDRAGSNNFTPANFSLVSDATYDPMLDAPNLYDNGGNGVGNYAVLNFLNKTTNLTSNAYSSLVVDSTGVGSTWPGIGGTMAVSSGKWYYEFSYGTAGVNSSGFAGFAETDITMDSDVTDQFSKMGGWFLRNDSAGLGEAYVNFPTTGSFGSGVDAPATGTVMLALDMDNNKFWVGRGGTWFNSGNPATGANGFSFAAGKTLMPFLSPSNPSYGVITYAMNFGQKAYAYTPPTGFKSWNTNNLPVPAIKDSSAYLKIVTYTGNGSYISVGDPVKPQGTGQIANSLRFKSSTSSYLTRSIASTSNRQTWTWSGWIKRSSLGTQQAIFGASSGPSNGYPATQLAWDNSVNPGAIDFVCFIPGIQWRIVTQQQFRDTSAWHHIVAVLDTTNATASDRVRLYVDGVRVTAFNTATYPSLNATSMINDSGGYYHTLGALNYTAMTNYMDGYMADVYFVDGQALDPTAFGTFDAKGSWAAKIPTGLTYGTNGYHLDFSKSSLATSTGIGADSSGNGNNWTPYGFTTASSFGAWDPTSNPSNTYSNSNLTVSGMAGPSTAVPAVSSGKWYWETTPTTVGPASESTVIGVRSTDGVSRAYVRNRSVDLQYGTQAGDQGLADSAVFQASTVYGMALDADAGTLKVYKANALIATIALPAGKTWRPMWWRTGSSATWNFNFGQSAFTYTAPASHNPIYAASGGYNLSGRFAAWDASSNASNTYTNNNLTIAGSGGDSTANDSAATGKYYWEGTPTTVGSNTDATQIGVKSSDGLSKAYVRSRSADLQYGTESGDQGLADSSIYQLGVVYAWALDADTRTLKVYKANTLIATVLLPAGKTWKPYWSRAGSSSTWSFNFGQQFFTYNPPTDYVAFAGTSVAYSSPDSYTLDVLKDTPTPYAANDGERGNYPTLNPYLAAGVSGSFYSGYGNLSMTVTSNSGYRNYSATIDPMGRKGYFEVGMPTGSPNFRIGFEDVTKALSNLTYQSAGTFSIVGSGDLYNGLTMTVAGYTPGFSTGETLMVAFDFTGSNRNVWYGRNGVWGSSGNPTSGANPAFTAASLTGTYRLYFGSNTGSGATVNTFNFGQQTFAYTPPSGFTALSTYNLPNTSFVPDLVITKNRTTAVDWAWYDRLRGSTMMMASSSTDAQTAQSSGLLNFQNGGFTAGASSNLNSVGNNYVSYLFKEGVTPGFDITTFDWTSGTLSVPHSLGVTPAMFIVKADKTGDHWMVWHQSLPNKQQSYLFLNQTTAVSTSAAVWANTAPTSTTVTLAGASANIIADTGFTGLGVLYSFAEVPGYSKFGSFTGTGTTDGAFVYTGFRPAFIMIKRTDVANSWTLLDNTRSDSNVVNRAVYPNLTNAEETSNNDTDFLSNGFKIRSGTDGRMNASGGTYIYAAFAEKPFKHSSAR